MLLQLTQFPLLRAIAVRHRHLPRVLALLGDIDDAEISQARNHQVREAIERFLVIEGTGEHVAGIGEKRQPLLRRFRFRPRRFRPDEFGPLLRLPLDLLGFFEEIDKDR